MKIFNKVTRIFKSGSTSAGFYSTINSFYKKFYDDFYMLHYPFYKSDEDSLIEGQQNLTNYCIKKLPSLKGKTILDIGCGNGIQTIYIYKNYHPAKIVGIDLNLGNIEIAECEKKKQKLDNIEFFNSDAQNISCVKDNSIDIVINIESAFHYPQKEKFLQEIYRVLKIDGIFLIADVLTNKNGKKHLFTLWKNNMNHFRWHEGQYETGLKNSGLDLTFTEDISDPVIKGFKQYRSWFDSMEIKNVVQRWFIKSWGKFVIKHNEYLLRKNRRYIIFIGSKPIVIKKPAHVEREELVNLN